MKKILKCLAAVALVGVTAFCGCAGGIFGRADVGENADGIKYCKSVTIKEKEKVDAGYDANLLKENVFFTVEDMQDAFGYANKLYQEKDCIVPFIYLDTNGLDYDRISYTFIGGEQTDFADLFMEMRGEVA